MTATSAPMVSVTRGDPHAVPHRLETGAAVEHVVDGNPAFLAAPHPAERAPLLAADRCADGGDAGIPERRGERAGRRHAYRRAVHDDRDEISHALAPVRRSEEHTSELQ